MTTSEFQSIQHNLSKLRALLDENESLRITLDKKLVHSKYRYRGVPTVDISKRILERFMSYDYWIGIPKENRVSILLACNIVWEQKRKRSK